MSAPGGGVVDLRDWWARHPRPRLPDGVQVLAGPPPGGSPGPGADRGPAAEGAGVRVALVDAQVDLDHPDLRGARVAAWSPGRGLSRPDPTGHATACASLLVGQGERHVRGVVAAAELLVAAALPERGSTPGAGDDAVARAVRWAVACGAHVVVLPFGRRRLGRLVATTLRDALAAGVEVVAAAGNLGPDLLAFPASVCGVLAVTGHDASGLVTGCSAYADAAAPGADVPAAGAGRFATLHGSSPAAVLAAGARADALARVLAVARADATRLTPAGRP